MPRSSFGVNCCDVVTSGFPSKKYTTTCTVQCSTGESKPTARLEQELATNQLEFSSSKPSLRIRSRGSTRSHLFAFDKRVATTKGVTQQLQQLPSFETNSWKQLLLLASCGIASSYSEMRNEQLFPRVVKTYSDPSGSTLRVKLQSARATRMGLYMYSKQVRLCIIYNNRGIYMCTCKY